MIIVPFSVILQVDKRMLKIKMYENAVVAVQLLKIER